MKKTSSKKRVLFKKAFGIASIVVGIGCLWGGMLYAVNDLELNLWGFFIAIKGCIGIFCGLKVLNF